MLNIMYWQDIESNKRLRQSTKYDINY